MTPGEKAWIKHKRLNENVPGARYNETAIVPSPWTKFGLGVRRSQSIEPQPRENNFSWSIAAAALFLLGLAWGFAHTNASYVSDIYAGKVSTPQGVYRTEKITQPTDLAEARFPCRHGCQNAPFYRGSSRMIHFWPNNPAHAEKSLQLVLDEANREGGTVLLPSNIVIDGGTFSIKSGLILVQDEEELIIKNNEFIFDDRIGNNEAKYE